MRAAWAALLLGGCVQSTWVLRLDAIGVGQPFLADDGCVVEVESASVHLREAVVLDSVGGRVGRIEGVTLALDAEPVFTPVTSVAARRLSGVRIVVGPPDDAFAPLALGDGGLGVTGTVSCDRGDVAFDWVLSGPAPQRCGRDDLAVPPSTTLVVPWQIDLPGLFASDLDAPPATPGVATDIVDADVDEDGDVTEAEIDNAPLDKTVRTGPADRPDRLGPWLDARSARLATLPGGWCRLATAD